MESPARGGEGQEPGAAITPAPVSTPKSGRGTASCPLGSSTSPDNSYQSWTCPPSGVPGPAGATMDPEASSHPPDVPCHQPPIPPHGALGFPRASERPALSSRLPYCHPAPGPHDPSPPPPARRAPVCSAPSPVRPWVCPSLPGPSASAGPPSPRRPRLLLTPPWLSVSSSSCETGPGGPCAPPRPGPPGARLRGARQGAVWERGPRRPRWGTPAAPWCPSDGQSGSSSLCGAGLKVTPHQLAAEKGQGSQLPQGTLEAIKGLHAPPGRPASGPPTAHTAPVTPRPAGRQGHAVLVLPPASLLLRPRAQARVSRH